jgi:NAD(P)-dependent dehydrogenase (short-subunit alcohol dehydrogenase family)
MNSLKNKIAVVTGGNSGIGLATAKEFVANGATVVITGRRQAAVDAAVAEIGGGTTGIVADAADVRQTESLVQQVKTLYGRVDVLFINAGVFMPAPLGSITEEMFDTQMGINFRGAVFTLERFLPLLSEGASVINLSSVNAYTGMANTAIYAASKAAMNSYTRTAATELAPRKIRVNAVNPGPVATEIFNKTGLPPEVVAGMAEAMQNRIPLKRFGKSEEVAKLVTFLASDDASFITGGEYNVDGGIALLK